MTNNKRSWLNASQDGERQQEAGPSQKRTRSCPVWEVRRSPSADPEHIAMPGAAPSSTNFEAARERLVEFQQELPTILMELGKIDEATMDNSQRAYISSVYALKTMLEQAVVAHAQRICSSAQTAMTSDMELEGQVEEASWTLPTDPVQLVRSPSDAKPSYHTMGSGRDRLPSTRFDSKIRDHVHDFISELERDHPELMTTPVRLRKPWVPDGHMEQRIVAYEHTINHYFVAEVALVIKAILNAKWPEARFEVIEGSPNGHADLFLHVRIKNADGLWVFSSVAVELKRPYGTDHEESAIASREQWPRWMRGAEIPNDKVAKHILRQIFDYMRGSDAKAPEYIKGSIASHIGFVSNYNSTWIISVESDTNADISSSSKNLSKCLCVSNRFSLDSTEIPIAFVYAYVLDEIIAKMKASRSGYKEEKGLEDDSE